MSLSDEQKILRLEKALACGGRTHTLTDVVQLLEQGRAMLWQQGDGCIVTEVHQYPLRKSVHYWLVFGALRDCLALQDQIDPWAIEQGCDLATAHGRKGWSRAAPGWQPWFQTYRKSLGG